MGRITFTPTAPTVETLKAFLNEFPDGKNAEEARAQLKDLERNAADVKAADEQRRQETEKQNAGPHCMRNGWIFDEYPVHFFGEVVRHLHPVAAVFAISLVSKDDK